MAKNIANKKVWSTKSSMITFLDKKSLKFNDAAPNMERKLRHLVDRLLDECYLINQVSIFSQFINMIAFSTSLNWHLLTSDDDVCPLVKMIIEDDKDQNCKTTFGKFSFEEKKEENCRAWSMSVE